MNLNRHRQEIYEVIVVYYDDKKLGKTPFVLRLKTLQQLTDKKIKLHEAINTIFEVEYFKLCKSERDITKYKKQIRKELVDMLKKLDINVKYSELTSTRTKKYQEFMDERMKEFDKKRIKDENFTKLVKTLRTNDVYLEQDMFHAVLFTLNDMTLKKQSFEEAVKRKEIRFKVDKKDVKKYIDMVRGDSK